MSISKNYKNCVNCEGSNLNPKLPLCITCEKQIYGTDNNLYVNIIEITKNGVEVSCVYNEARDQISLKLTVRTPNNKIQKVLYQECFAIEGFSERVVCERLRIATKDLLEGVSSKDIERRGYKFLRQYKEVEEKLAELSNRTADEDFIDNLQTTISSYFEKYKEDNEWKRNI